MMKEADRETYRLRFKCIHKNKKPKKQSSDCSNGTMVNRPVTEHLVSQYCSPSMMACLVTKNQTVTWALMNSIYFHIELDEDRDEMFCQNKL
jgi:hypothetical protein